MAYTPLHLKEKRSLQSHPIAIGFATLIWELSIDFFFFSFCDKPQSSGRNSNNTVHKNWKGALWNNNWNKEEFFPAFFYINNSKYSSMHKPLWSASLFIRKLLCSSSNVLLETSLVILCSPATDKGLTVTNYWLVNVKLKKAMGSPGRQAMKSCE